MVTVLDFIVLCCAREGVLLVPMRVIIIIASYAQYVAQQLCEVVIITMGCEL